MFQFRHWNAEGKNRLSDLHSQLPSLVPAAAAFRPLDHGCNCFLLWYPSTPSRSFPIGFLIRDESKRGKGERALMWWGDFIPSAVGRELFVYTLGVKTPKEASLTTGTKDTFETLEHSVLSLWFARDPFHKLPVRDPLHFPQLSSGSTLYPCNLCLLIDIAWTFFTQMILTWQLSLCSITKAVGQNFLNLLWLLDHNQTRAHSGPSVGFPALFLMCGRKDCLSPQSLVLS